MRKWCILFFVLTVLVMGIIFWFSSQNGDQSKHVSDIVSTKITINHTAVDGKQERVMSMAVRKTAHVVLFGLLGCCAVLTLRCYNTHRRWWIHAVAAFCFCMLYAISDELHQTIVDGRTGRALDVLIDCGGAVLGIFAALYGFRHVVKLNKKPA